MAKKGEHVIFTIHFVHIIAKTQRIHPYRNIIESTDDIILQTFKVHRDITFQTFKSISTSPKTLIRFALQGTHHSIRIVHSFLCAQLISVIPSFHLIGIHSHFGTQLLYFIFRKAEIRCKLSRTQHCIFIEIIQG